MFHSVLAELAPRDISCGRNGLSGVWENNTRPESAQFLPFRAKAPQLWEQAFLIRAEVFTSRGRLGQEGRASWPGSSKQLTDWLCVMVGSGCIFINSSRLTCSAEACKAVWACLCSAGVRDWAVRVQRGNLQEVGRSPKVTWQKPQGHREELFICLQKSFHQFFLSLNCLRGKSKFYIELNGIAC